MNSTSIHSTSSLFSHTLLCIPVLSPFPLLFVHPKKRKKQKFTTFYHFLTNKRNEEEKKKLFTFNFKIKIKEPKPNVEQLPVKCVSPYHSAM